MNKEEITVQLKDILVEEFEVDREELSEDAPLMKTLDLDNLDVVDMVVLIENYFHFKMKKEDFAAPSRTRSVWIYASRIFGMGRPLT